MAHRNSVYCIAKLGWKQFELSEVEQELQPRALSHSKAQDITLA